MKTLANLVAAISLPLAILVSSVCSQEPINGPIVALFDDDPLGAFLMDRPEYSMTRMIR